MPKPFWGVGIPTLASSPSGDVVLPSHSQSWHRYSCSRILECLTTVYPFPGEGVSYFKKITAYMDSESLAQDDFRKFKDGIGISAILVELRWSLVKGCDQTDRLAYHKTTKLGITQCLTTI